MFPKLTGNRFVVGTASSPAVNNPESMHMARRVGVVAVGFAGFTLIELLVVIAIIGILASIVLVSLSSARSKGKDTRVISDVRQARVQLDAEQTIGGTYYTGGSNCVASIGASGAATISGSGNCGSLNSDATANGGSLQIQTAASSGASSFGSYAVYGPLSTGYFCMDSAGNTLQKTGSIPSAASTATCR